MKIFAIRDESAQEQKDLAYLLYYEQKSDSTLNCLRAQTHGRRPCCWIPL